MRVVASHWGLILARTGILIKFNQTVEPHVTAIATLSVKRMSIREFPVLYIVLWYPIPEYEFTWERGFSRMRRIHSDQFLSGNVTGGSKIPTGSYYWSGSSSVEIIKNSIQTRGIETSTEIRFHFWSARIRCIRVDPRSKSCKRLPQGIFDDVRGMCTNVKREKTLLSLLLPVKKNDMLNRLLSMSLVFSSMEMFPSNGRIEILLRNFPARSVLFRDVLISSLSIGRFQVGSVPFQLCACTIGDISEQYCFG